MGGGGGGEIEVKGHQEVEEDVSTISNVGGEIEVKGHQEGGGGT